MISIVFSNVSSPDGKYIYLPNACSAYTAQLMEFNFFLDVIGTTNITIVSLANFASTNANNMC